MVGKRTFFDNRGFTLIELLTVMLIIGILFTIMAVAVKYAKNQANIAAAQHDLDQIEKSIRFMADDTGQWPGHQRANMACVHIVPGGCPANNEICDADENGNTCQHNLSSGYAGLLTNHMSNHYPRWHGPYIKEALLTDPWGHKYFFDTDYSVDINNDPCGCGAGGCVDVAVIGSYGPDGLGKPDGSSPGAYGCDDIIKILER